MKKGLFITFEGIDGSGKTTRLEKTAEYLRSKGYDVIETLEPGALETGKEIRKLLLHSKNEISDRAEMFLFLADRANHVQMMIEPALNEGKIVLCDRFIESTLAYQGFGRGQNIELLKKLNEIAAGGLTPDLTLLCDIDASIAFKRLNREQDRMEKAGLEFQKKVRAGYLELQRQEPERIKIIDTSNGKDENFEAAIQAVKQLLQEKRGE